MYESPINIICKDMKWHMENNIMHAIQSSDITVDKNELIKALKYDREQYEKGYTDGQRAGERIAKVTYLEMSRNPKNIIWKCENCGQYMHRTAWGNPVNYCSRCGLKIDWGENE